MKELEIKLKNQIELHKSAKDSGDLVGDAAIRSEGCIDGLEYALDILRRVK